MSFPVTIRGPQTAADWAIQNPVLNQFEMGIEIDPATGALTQAKMGDGVRDWNDLTYFSLGPGALAALTSSLPTGTPNADDVFAYNEVTPAVARVVVGTFTGAIAEGGVITLGGLIGTAGGAFPADALPQDVVDWFVPFGIETIPAESAIVDGETMIITFAPGTEANALICSSTDPNLTFEDDVVGEDEVQVAKRATLTDIATAIDAILNP